MAKSNLAEIHTSFEDAIANENEAPRIAVGDTMTSIAGFRFPDQVVIESKKVRRRADIERYKNDAGILRNKLAGADVKPLAVLPKKAWNRLCSESGLLQIEPNGDGKVSIDPRPIAEKLDNIAAGITIPLIIAIHALWIYGIFSLPVWHDSPIVFIGIFAIIGSVAAAVPFIAMGADKGTGPWMWLYRRIVDLVVFTATKLKPRSWWVRQLLLPLSTHGSSTATVVLPTPPADVAEILKNANRAGTLYVAAVPDAIGFQEPVADILAHELYTARQIRQSAWSAALPRLDPIIYMVQDSAVAIIAQFGDFPIEREIIQRVAASEHLL